MRNMTKAKKLIEVALPIKEISAESVRDKSIRHGHISTLHVWWARRPLPACRAVVFASLVPDPLDENCPQAFKDAVKAVLAPDDFVINQEYKPYKDIPYTAVFDPLEDNLRNRLLMFIGKFSDQCQQNMLVGKSTPPKEQLSDGSLIKWENKNDAKVLRRARELIFVAYNAEKTPNITYDELHKAFNKSFDAITEAEDNLYSLINRHLPSKEKDFLEQKLKEAIENFQNQMPSVFDPFAGGGAIPLEAARLGCRSYGNDINPVAHIIEKGSAEFPQKYGKPIVYSKAEFVSKYGEEALKLINEEDRNIKIDNEGNIYIPNRLSFDVEFYAKKLLAMTEAEVGYLYPPDENGNKPVAYYWARTAKCSNPSCGAEIPLLKGFYLCNTTRKKYYLKPIIEGKNINFEIAKGTCNIKGWNNRGNITCPCCGNITMIDLVKEQSKQNVLKERLLAVIHDSKLGKTYLLPSEKMKRIVTNSIPNINRPQEYLPVKYIQAFPVCSWGYSRWGNIFSDRQIYMLNSWIKNFNILKQSLESNDDYYKVIIHYLAIWFDRIAIVNTSFGIWNTIGEKIERIMGRQALSMCFDYPESNPFCHSSGSALNQLEWLIRYFESESDNIFSAVFANASSGERTQFKNKEITTVVTDPPYYDAISYADCSDFFYVWLKRTLGELYPLVFATPQTPKVEECTAIKHRFDGDLNLAKKHFENKLTQVFDSIERQTSDIVSIMFAHQSTEAWTTLCNSILGSRMNITGSWPMDTEREGGLKINMAFLESSVTVACRPSERKGFGEYKEIKRNIEKKVSEEVEFLYDMGFRGADLLTACFGQAVSEFGLYQTVEKADGSEVSVAELLEMARTSAFNALLKGIQGDDYTKFYIGWLQLNGVGETDYDDATKFTRVGVNVDINDIKQNKLLVINGKKIHLAMAEEHLGRSSLEGTKPEDSLISQAHRAILLYREGSRTPILEFVKNVAPESGSPLWRLLATLKELLPANDDQKQVTGLLGNAEDLRQHCHDAPAPVQGKLGI